MSEPEDDSLHLLFVAPYLPSAIRVRPFQLIRHLAKAGHRVTVAALGDNSPADTAALAELRAVCEKVYVVQQPRLRAATQAVLALPSPTPLAVAWCHSPPMRRLLHLLAASRKFDVAHVEHLRAAHFATALGELPIVFDAVDCITDLQTQVAAQTHRTSPRYWLAREEAAKLRRYEPGVCNGFWQIVVTSRHDADALASLGVDSPVVVIPNGVERGILPPPADEERGTKRFDLILSGKMSYQANEDAALFLLNDILPHLDMLLPNVPPVSVCLAGARPSDHLRWAASRWENRVTITGWVDDLRPLLAVSRIAVCPIRIGVGIQNKMLEAMAMGLPVVATPLAARAFGEDTSLTGLRIGANAETFARHCAELLGSADYAHWARKAGWDYVRRFHRWESAAEAFIAQYRKAISG